MRATAGRTPHTTPTRLPTCWWSGASAAGLSTVEALRRHGYAGKVTVLGAETHPPYDRPPLSKQVLAGTWRPDRARLRPREALSALDAAFILGDPAVGLDASIRTVRTASGRALRAEALVVATGTRPRTLPGQAGFAGVHVLRTLDDALALRTGLLSAARLVAFGFGVHQCLGQPLARLELQAVYSTLCRRIPTLRLATDIERIPFKHDGGVYGVYELPVTW